MIVSDSKTAAEFRDEAVQEIDRLIAAHKNAWERAKPQRKARIHAIVGELNTLAEFFSSIQFR